MFGPIIALAALALALAWTLVNRAGVYPADWSITLLALGLVSFCYWQFTDRRDLAPALPPWLRFVIWGLPAYVAFQLAPLPLALLQVLSPARAQLARSLEPIIPGVQAAPLSSDVSATILGLFTILGYVATFFLVRELAWRWINHCWVPLLPLLLLATFEAGLGCYQFLTGKSPHAYGTYTNYDHFAGLLEMALPPTALYGVVLFAKLSKNGRNSMRPVVAACAAWTLAALLLLGITCSLSRGGFVIALCTLFLSAALGIGFQVSSRVLRRNALFIAAGVIVLLAVALPSEQLVGRLSLSVTPGASEKTSIDTRVQLWRQTAPLIAKFPVFGCGLGGYESNFLQYQAVAYAYRVQFAHNDYLQALAELGFVGFTLILLLAYGVMSQIFKGMSRLVEGERRLLVIACGGSLVAILLHSLVDFNLHIPANGIILAWIAGVGSINGLD
jgi:O-antigen ligase